MLLGDDSFSKFFFNYNTYFQYVTEMTDMTGFNYKSQCELNIY